MIFEEKKIVKLSLDPANGQDTIVYPIGDDNNRAYAFMAIVYFVLEESMTLIYVGITEGQIDNQTTPVDIRDKFFRTDFKGVQGLSQNQKLGLEPNNVMDLGEFLGTRVAKGKKRKSNKNKKRSTKIRK